MTTTNGNMRSMNPANQVEAHSWISTSDTRQFLTYCKTGNTSCLSDMPHSSQRRAILHARDVEGNTALMVTVIHQQMQPFLSILHSLSHPSLTSASTLPYLHLFNRCGHTALHLSLIFTNRHMLTALIQAGCDPLMEDAQLQNAFHYIANLKLIGFPALIHSTLLSKHNHNSKEVREIERALLSARDSEGMTPVHRAIGTHQQLNLVRELMNPGTGDKHESVTEMMEDRKLRGDVLRVLTGKCRSSALHLAVATGNAMLVAYVLLQLPFSDVSQFVNFSNGHGDTALHTAVAWDRLECVKCLLSNGSNVDMRNEEWELPLDYCVSEEMRSLLLPHSQIN